MNIVNLIKTEPALFTGIAQAVIGVIASFGFTLTAGQSGAVLGATTFALGLIAAIATRPFQVSALSGAGTAIGTVLLAFGVPHASAGEVAAVNALLAVMLGLVVRLHVTPVASLPKAPATPPAAA